MKLFNVIGAIALLGLTAPVIAGDYKEKAVEKAEADVPTEYVAEEAVAEAADETEVAEEAASDIEVENVKLDLSAEVEEAAEEITAAAEESID